MPLRTFLAFLLSLGLLMLPQGAVSLGKVVGSEYVEPIVEKIDLIGRLGASFMVGALDTGHVVFFVAWIAAILFVTIRLLEARRWR